MIADVTIFPYTFDGPKCGEQWPAQTSGPADIMQSFDFQVVLNAPLETVFAIYIDVERWRNRIHFGDIRWVQGKPWEEGSRLRIETKIPIRSVVDQVVQHYSPDDSVSYLSHVFGITCETRVTFTPVFSQQTAINVTMNLVGTASRRFGFALVPAIKKAMKGFFEEIRKECEAAGRDADRTEQQRST